MNGIETTLDWPAASETVTDFRANVRFVVLAAMATRVRGLPPRKLIVVRRESVARRAFGLNNRSLRVLEALSPTAAATPASTCCSNVGGVIDWAAP